MNEKRLIFCDVTSVEGPMVTMFSSSNKRKFDLLKYDFPCEVEEGDRICMKGSFFHSKVPKGAMPKEYIDSLVRALK